MRKGPAVTALEHPRQGERRLRVLVVDDSAVMCRLIADGLSREADLEVVGTALDAFVARELILERAPDVLTLDLEMPRLDGLTFLRTLMAHHPMPVIVVSSLTPAGSSAAVAALRAGAVDVLAKPPVAGRAELTAGLVARLRALRTSPPARFQAGARQETAHRQRPLVQPARGLVVMGASTGGIQVIEGLLSRLPENLPPVAIVQHMPRPFTRNFAERLDQVTGLRVVEVVDGEALLPGHAYVAPGDRHLLVESGVTTLQARLSEDPQVHHQRPSVDVLFASAARVRGRAVVGVLLTGMGTDGAEGLGTLRRSGATTIAQSEASSVVFGMPGEAIARNAAVHVAAWPDMPALICEAFEQAGRRAGRSHSGFDGP